MAPLRPLPLLALLLLLLSAVPVAAKVTPGGGKPVVRLGVDRLLVEFMPLLRGKRVGLLTHQAGVTATGRRTADALIDRGVDLRALFAPEHGIYGKIEGGFDVAHTTYGRKKIPVHSLYGKTRRPTPAMLAGLDLVLVDLQDVGARFYTYISTVCYLLDEAAKMKIAVWVLDRPNPLGGLRVEGRTQDKNKLGFTAIYPMPLLHGMTMGEVAGLLNREYHYNAQLRVVKMKGWRRDMLFGETGLRWVAPSPNLPTWESTLTYPGLETIQGNGFLAEGRGTPLPFQLVGAPWIRDGRALAAKLAACRMPGLKFVPIQFTPKTNSFKDRLCRGVRIVVTDPHAMVPMLLPLHVLRILKADYPALPGWSEIARSWAISLGLPRGASDLQDGRAIERVMAQWEAGNQEFRATRRKYLLYRS